MRTAELCAYFEKLAPLGLAESWDNVGLLVDGGRATSHERIGLTIELDEATLDEAIEAKIEFLFVYHPPIFAGLKRVTLSDPNSKLVVRALENGISVYSPHTALDAARGGMGEWLAEALGAGSHRPIAPRSSPGEEMLGGGRLVDLAAPVPFEGALELIKRHLSLETLRVARSPFGRAEIHSLAVCPGAGGSLFEKVGRVDLLLTGEMRHHDVVSRVRRGTHVVLTEHTNSERGFLPRLRERIVVELPQLDVRVLASDRDPLESY